MNILRKNNFSVTVPLTASQDPLPHQLWTKIFKRMLTATYATKCHLQGYKLPPGCKLSPLWLIGDNLQPEGCPFVALEVAFCSIRGGSLQPFGGLQLFEGFVP